MSEFIQQAKAAWVGARQRDFNRRTRGIMTPEERKVIEDTFDAALAEHDRQVAERAWDEGASAMRDIYGDVIEDNPYWKEQS